VSALRFLVDLLGFVDRDFLRRVGHQVCHRFHGKNLDVARLQVHFRDQVFLRFVVFARRDENGIPHGLHDDGRVDPFELAEIFDLRINPWHLEYFLAVTL
jgi:hypothetical protein